MDITPLIAADAKVVQSVRDGEVKVNGTWIPCPIIIRPDAISEWDGVDWSVLSAQIILMGTGETSHLPDLETRKHAKAQNLNIEWMSNAAAARTYNVLMSEGRDVIAAFSQTP